MFDGKGNITTALFTSFQTNQCVYQGSGTYAVTGTASGFPISQSVNQSAFGLATTINWQLAGNASTCEGVGPTSFILEAAQQGSSFLLLENDQQGSMSIAGLKQ